MDAVGREVERPCVIGRSDKLSTGHAIVERCGGDEWVERDGWAERRCGDGTELYGRAGRDADELGECTIVVGDCRRGRDVDSVEREVERQCVIGRSDKLSAGQHIVERCGCDEWIERDGRAERQCGAGN